MIVDMNQERLKSIRSRKIWFEKTQCSKCGNFFVHESMWMVPRWGINETRHEWFYCKHCLPTKEDVLKEVYSDSCIFGIYNVDSFLSEKPDVSILPPSDVPQLTT